MKIFRLRDQFCKPAVGRFTVDLNITRSGRDKTRPGWRRIVLNFHGFSKGLGRPS